MLIRFFKWVGNGVINLCESSWNGVKSAWKRVQRAFSDDIVNEARDIREEAEEAIKNTGSASDPEMLLEETRKLEKRGSDLEQVYTQISTIVDVNRKLAKESSTTEIRKAKLIELREKGLLEISDDEIDAHLSQIEAKNDEMIAEVKKSKAEIEEQQKQTNVELEVIKYKVKLAEYQERIDNGETLQGDDAAEYEQIRSDLAMNTVERYESILAKLIEKAEKSKNKKAVRKIEKVTNATNQLAEKQAYTQLVLGTIGDQQPYEVYSNDGNKLLQTAKNDAVKDLTGAFRSPRRIYRQASSDVLKLDSAMQLIEERRQIMLTLRYVIDDYIEAKESETPDEELIQTNKAQLLSSAPSVLSRLNEVNGKIEKLRQDKSVTQQVQLPKILACKYLKNNLTILIETNNNDDPDFNGSESLFYKTAKMIWNMIRGNWGGNASDDAANDAQIEDQPLTSSPSMPSVSVSNGIQVPKLALGKVKHHRTMSEGSLDYSEESFYPHNTTTSLHGSSSMTFQN